MMAFLKAKQDDLLCLIKERRENLLNQKNGIDSPFAKYNSLGQLSCTICNIQIKSYALWATHVAGKIHKKNASKKKKGSLGITSKVVPQISKKASEMQPPPIEKMKMNVTDVSHAPAMSELIKKSKTLSLLKAYSSSEDEDDSEPMGVSSSVSNNELPKDFFDAAPTSLFPINEEKPKTKEEKPAAEFLNSVEALAEGFFDDPVPGGRMATWPQCHRNAKARSIEYSNVPYVPTKEEWEKNQKAIAEETDEGSSEKQWKKNKKNKRMERVTKASENYAGNIEDEGPSEEQWKKYQEKKRMQLVNKAWLNYERSNEYYNNPTVAEWEKYQKAMAEDPNARSIEYYNDPTEEEWEKYQKAIAEETNVAKTKIEEDFAAMYAERDRQETYEQIRLWERFAALQLKADEITSRLANQPQIVPPTNKNDGLSGSSDDELDEDDLLNWRAKGIKNVKRDKKI